eukprot:GHVU01221750.1.p1 GENE.GHVU01221750.1~~GHVU01221750.1.p1  ORF type:complete len:120 (+),score=13.04 GHVU01221750.1:76-435(+)
MYESPTAAAVSIRTVGVASVPVGLEQSSVFDGVSEQHDAVQPSEENARQHIVERGRRSLYLAPYTSLKDGNKDPPILAIAGSQRIDDPERFACAQPMRERRRKLTTRAWPQFDDKMGCV